MAQVTPPATATTDNAVEQVRQAELAFARSMRERNLAQFTEWVSQEAVFFGSERVHRGRTAVVAAWKGFFVGPAAPFSWEPKTVEVLASGTLAHSSGPVFDPQGKHIANGVLTANKAGGDGKPFLKVTLTEIFVTSVQSSGSSEVPTESVSFSYGTIKVEYSKQNEQGVLTASGAVTYDVKQNKLS